jgi:tetratricopeptide (TPR) repeat protein
MKFLPAAILLVLAGLAGLLAESARDDAGIISSPAQVPLGGFEPLAVDLLFLRAEKLIEEQRLPEAIAAVRLVTELQPRVPDAWSILGNTIAWRNSESSGDPEEQWKYAREAITIFERGLEHNPDSKQLYFSFGIFFLMRLVEDEDLRPVAERELGAPPAAFALKAFHEADRLSPDDWPVISGMAESARLYGLRLIKLEDWTGAKAALKESIRHFERLFDRSGGEVLQKKLNAIRAILEDLESR